MTRKCAGGCAGASVQKCGPSQQQRPRARCCGRSSRTGGRRQGDAPSLAGSPRDAAGRWGGSRQSVTLEGTACPRLQLPSGTTSRIRLNSVILL